MQMHLPTEYLGHMLLYQIKALLQKKGSCFHCIRIRHRDGGGYECDENLV
jgi:hypothetical protein